MSTKLEWKTQTLNGHTIDSSVTPDEVAALAELATDQYVMEIGSAFGYSAIVMAQTAKHVTAVDPHAGELPDSLEVMRANLTLHGVADKVTIVQAYSQDALPQMLAAGNRFGCIFVDGNHNVQVENDVYLALKLLTEDGLIAVHDYDQYDFPEITRVMNKYTQVKVVDSLWIGHA